ncbi:MAG: HRDC domain-containing protein [Myxococcota bacterium]|nr:HRDC domain-containing protein [Myxococcota bacterium]
MYRSPLFIVDTPEKLQEMVAMLEGEPVIGIDTEADSMYAYQEKVCLVQVSDRNRDYIIDPLAGFSLDPLAPFMEDPEIVKIFHGADYDVVSMKRDFGFTFRNLFDTMITAQILGLPRVGLADLCDRYFGVLMEKKYQTHNWALRPLQPEHLDYARGDTHYLLALRELFVRKLQRTGRMAIAQEEFALVEDREWSLKVPKEQLFRKMKGANKLDDKALRALRGLWDMRDAHAERMNRPPYKVIPNQVLLKLAEKRPETLEQLGKHVRAGSSMVRRYGEEMVAAIQSAMETTDELPDVPKKVRSGTRAKYGSREVERLFNQLKEWRSQVLKRDKVPMILVGSNSQLKAIAGTRPASLQELGELEEIRDWQVDIYGEELLELVAAFEAGMPKKRSKSKASSDDDAPKKRRRRRRRKSGDDAQPAQES